MKVERKADRAVSDSSCKSATGKTLAGWFEALDRHGGVALGRRTLSKWIEHEHDVGSWWTKSIKASPKDCFAGFANAKALDAWFGATHDVDLRDGGHWRNADGNRASIQKVNAGKNIRLIAEDVGLTWPTPVQIKFTPNGRNCTVMVAIDRLQTRAEADGYRRAWGEALERLKIFVERSRADAAD